MVFRLISSREWFFPSTPFKHQIKAAIGPGSDIIASPSKASPALCVCMNTFDRKMGAVKAPTRRHGYAQAG